MKQLTPSWDLVSVGELTEGHVNAILPKLIQVRTSAAETPTTIQHLLTLEAQSLVAPEAAHSISSPPSSLASSFSESSECTLPESPQKFIAEISRFCNCLATARGGFFVEFVQADTRESVVAWIGQVIVAMRWPLGAFFTAVHAFDFSLTDQSRHSKDNGGLITTHPVHPQKGTEGCIPLLSTACVLVGVSSECDHKQLAKARCFVGQVPNVTSVRDIICKQLSIVAFLDRGTLVNKTPLDFTVLFLASLKIHAPDTFHILMTKGIPDKTRNSSPSLLRYVCQAAEEDTEIWSLGCLLVELCLGVSVVAAVTQAYCGYPMSRIIAAIILDVVSRVDRQDSLNWFCATVFRLDYRWEILPVVHRLPGIYRACKHFDKSENGSSLIAWPAKANLLLDLLLS